MLATRPRIDDQTPENQDMGKKYPATYHHLFIIEPRILQFSPRTEDTSRIKPGKNPVSRRLATIRFPDFILDRSSFVEEN
jgi:hypothetical protein